MYSQQTSANVQAEMFFYDYQISQICKIVSNVIELEHYCVGTRVLYVSLHLSNLDASSTCMECPVGLRGNLKVSLKEGSLSCRQTLVFFLMILFCVATFTTYNLTYRSKGNIK